MFLEIYEVGHLPSQPVLATLKKTKVKLDVVTNINMLLMAEKFVKGGICHANYQYAKAHNKYMKNYDKIKELSEM